MDGNSSGGSGGSYKRSQSRRRRQVTWSWHDRKFTTCGWILNPQGLEPTRQICPPQRVEAPTETQDADVAIPNARPARPIGATLDSPLARQTRAKKNLALVEVQLTAAQQKMEEAKSRKGSGGQAGGRSQTTLSARHLDLCRRRDTGASSATSTPATHTPHRYSRSSNENDRRTG